MKNYALCIIFTLVFYSCNVPKEGEQESLVTGKKEVETNLESVDTNNVNEEKVNEVQTNSRVLKNTKLLLIARGSEPGWYAEFFEDHLRLLIDYGTDSLILEKDFSKINADKAFNTSLENKSTPPLIISISEKPCVEEASGEKREKSISIKYKNKTYKGCASSKNN